MFLGDYIEKMKHDCPSLDTNGLCSMNHKSVWCCAGDCAASWRGELAMGGRSHCPLAARKRGTLPRRDDDLAAPRPSATPLRGLFHAPVPFPPCFHYTRRLISHESTPFLIRSYIVIGCTSPCMRACVRRTRSDNAICKGSLGCWCFRKLS